MVRERILVVESGAAAARRLAARLDRPADIVALAHGDPRTVRVLDDGVDLFLCDVDAPDAVALVRHAAHAPHIPRIVALSGGLTAASAFAVAQSGAAAFLERPFSDEELAAVLDVPPAQLPRVRAIAAAYVGNRSLADASRELRLGMFEHALRRSGGNYSMAAKMLGISRQAMQQWMQPRPTPRRTRRG